MTAYGSVYGNCGLQQIFVALPKRPTAIILKRRTYLSGESWPRPDALMVILEYFGVDANILLHEMDIERLKIAVPKPVDLGFERGVRAAAVVAGEYCQERIKKAEKFDNEAVFTKHAQHDIQRAILRRVLLEK